MSVRTLPPCEYALLAHAYACSQNLHNAREYYAEVVFGYTREERVKAMARLKLLGLITGAGITDAGACAYPHIHSLSYHGVIGNAGNQVTIE